MQVGLIGLGRMGSAKLPSGFVEKDWSAMADMRIRGRDRVTSSETHPEKKS